ncbi:MAG: helix-turn-helix domain-containing protein [Halanaerobiales bacterium]
MKTNKLRQVRLKKGISQERLASEAGMVQADISQLENNKKYAYPGWRKRLSKALGVNEDTLFPEV